jgi:hypothetical protein
VPFLRRFSARPSPQTLCVKIIWYVDINWKRSDLNSEAELDEIIKQSEGFPRLCLDLEKVRFQKRSKFEKVLYTLLGLSIEENVPTGSIQACFSGKFAHVVFIKNDDDNGAIATTEKEQIECSAIEFTLPSGEKYSEPYTMCISRPEALEAIREFYKSKKRPSAFIWVAVNKRITRRLQSDTQKAARR